MRKSGFIFDAFRECHFFKNADETFQEDFDLEEAKTSTVSFLKVSSTSLNFSAKL